MKLLTYYENQRHTECRFLLSADYSGLQNAEFIASQQVCCRYNRLRQSPLTAFHTLTILHEQTSAQPRGILPDGQYMMCMDQKKKDTVSLSEAAGQLDDDICWQQDVKEQEKFSAGDRGTLLSRA